MGDTPTAASVTLASFATSIGTNAAIGAAILLAWAAVRRKLKVIYAARWLSSRLDAEPQSALEAWQQRDPSTNAAFLDDPRVGFFKLFYDVIMLPDAKLLAAVGLDAYMFIRLIRIGIFFFAAITGVYGVLVLLPINLRNGISDATPGGSTDFNVMGIAAVPAASSMLWAHAVSVYVFSLSLCWLLMNSYRRYLPLRYAYLAVPQPARYSCVMVNLPPTVIDDTSLYKLANSLYPGQVHSVCLFTKTGKVLSAFEERQALVQKLKGLRATNEKRFHVSRIRAQQDFSGGLRGTCRWLFFNCCARTRYLFGVGPPVRQVSGIETPRMRRSSTRDSGAHEAVNVPSSTRMVDDETVRAQTFVPWWNFFSPRRDAVEYFEGKLQKLDRKLLYLRAVGTSRLPAAVWSRFKSTSAGNDALLALSPRWDATNATGAAVRVGTPMPVRGNAASTARSTLSAPRAMLPVSPPLTSASATLPASHRATNPSVLSLRLHASAQSMSAQTPMRGSMSAHSIGTVTPRFAAQQPAPGRADAHGAVPATGTDVSDTVGAQPSAGTADAGGGAHNGTHVDATSKPAALMDLARASMSTTLTKAEILAFEHALPLYYQLVKNPRDSVAFAQARVLSRVLRRGVYQPTSAGVVTFNNLAIAQIAPQVMNVRPSFRLADLEFVRAPEPRDLDYGNVSMSSPERLARQRAAMALAVVVTLFYTIPVSFIASLATIESLARIFPGIEKLLADNTLAVSFIQGFLPSILLQIVLGLIPTVMGMLARYGGARSNTEAMITTIRFMFGFRLWTTLLVFTVTGSIWDAISIIVEAPDKILSILASTLPRLASFYTSWVALQALSSAPLTLLSIGRVLCYGLRRWRVRTPADARALRDSIAGNYEYATELPEIMLVFIIGIIYTSINPLISPVCVLYFGIMLCVHKYRLLYMTTKRMEAGGTYWPVTVNRIIFGLFVYQLTMIGLLTLKEAPTAAAFVIGCPVITILFWWYMDTRYRRSSEYLPMDLCRNPQTAFKAAFQRHKGSVLNPVDAAAAADLRVVAAMDVLRGRIITTLRKRAEAARNRLRAQREAAGASCSRSDTFRSPLSVTSAAATEGMPPAPPLASIEETGILRASHKEVMRPPLTPKVAATPRTSDSGSNITTPVTTPARGPTPSGGPHRVRVLKLKPETSSTPIAADVIEGATEDGSTPSATAAASAATLTRSASASAAGAANDHGTRSTGPHRVRHAVLRVRGAVGADEVGGSTAGLPVSGGASRAQGAVATPAYALGMAYTRVSAGSRTAELDDHAPGAWVARAAAAHAHNARGSTVHSADGGTVAGASTAVSAVPPRRGGVAGGALRSSLVGGAANLSTEVITNSEDDDETEDLTSPQPSLDGVLQINMGDIMPEENVDGGRGDGGLWRSPTTGVSFASPTSSVSTASQPPSVMRMIADEPERLLPAVSPLNVHEAQVKVSSSGVQDLRQTPLGEFTTPSAGAQPYRRGLPHWQSLRTLFTSSYVRPVAAEEYSKKHGGVSLQPLQFQMVGASDVLRNVDIADVPERRRAARERQLVALHDAVQIVEDTMRNVYLHAPLRPKFDSVYIYEDKFVSPFIVDDSAVI